MLLVNGSCNHCHRDIGPVPWYADLVLCKRCSKADEVYTPPHPPRMPDYSRELIRRLEAERREAERSASRQ